MSNEVELKEKLGGNEKITVEVEMSTRDRLCALLTLILSCLAIGFTAVITLYVVLCK